MPTVPTRSPKTRKTRKTPTAARKLAKPISADAQFAEEFSALVSHRRHFPLPQKAIDDEGLAARARDLAVSLAIVGFYPSAPSADVDIARALVDAAWRAKGVVTKRNGEYLHEKVRAEPWQLALEQVFAVGARLPIEPFRAAAMVLRQLVRTSGVKVPAAFVDAEVAIRKAKTLVDLPPKIRERVQRAVRMLEALRGPVAADGRPTLRLTWDKAGGRGAGRKRSPWGAAVQFARAFNVNMPERLHDTRVRAR